MRYILLILSVLLASCATQQTLTEATTEGCNTTFEGIELTGKLCEDFDSFRATVDFSTKASVFAVGEAIYDHRRKIAVNAAVVIEGTVNPVTLAEVTKLAAEVCLVTDCEDSLGKYLKRLYLQKVSRLSDSERGDLTKRTIEHVITSLPDQYAKYVDCTKAEGECSPAPKLKKDDPVLAISNLGSGIFYVEIPFLYEETPEYLAQAIKDFDELHGLRGLVLDMRYYPGGYLDSSLTITDMFLANKVKMLYMLRSLNYIELHRSDDRDITDGAPIVALSNGSSMSNTELIMQALQSNDRAVIFGDHSYGKNQEVSRIPLKNGDVIYLSTGLYWSKDLESIADKGVTPDRIIDQNDTSTCNLPVAGEVDATVCAAYNHLLEQQK